MSMARTVDEKQYAEKRNEILDVVQRFVFTTGYENMSIKDVIRELEISSGAFYHYFDSKTALLEALIARIKEETEKPFLPILNNPDVNAIEKLQGFFDTLDSLRLANKANVVQLSRIWYTDANTIVRQKVNEAIIEQRAPLLNQIVHQGIEEGVFTTTYPDKSGEVMLVLLEGMGNTHARLLLSIDADTDTTPIIEEIVSVHEAYMDALERTLGAPSHSLYRAKAEEVTIWVNTIKADVHKRQS
jgi:AcrR family transcriptional regulator